MKNVFKQIHLWISVPFGLIITLICFSGAMLVFEQEVNELRQPDLYFAAPEGRQPLPIEQLMEKVAATLPDSVSVTGVTISSDPKRTYQVSLSNPRRASVYVNPYTGEVKGKSERASFFLFMFRMHRWLLDSMKPDGGISVGKTVVGISVLLFVIVLITGVVIWWPRTRRALKNSLKICANKGWKRFWYDLHVAGGMYALIFLLAMALTGLTWSFPWYRTAFYKVFGVEAQQRPMRGQEDKGNASKEGRPQAEGEHRGERGGRPERNAAQQAEGEHRGERGGRPERNAAQQAEGEYRGKRGGRPERNAAQQAEGEHRRERGGRPERNAAPQAEPETGVERPERISAFAHWQDVYNRLSSQNTDYKQITLSDGRASVTLNQVGNQRASDTYTFDPKSGEITGTSYYKDQDKSGKMHGWIYAVHTGMWGGLLTRILAFIAALIGASLPLTGYYLWIKRLVQKRSSR